VLRLRRRRRCRLSFCDAGKKAADNGVAWREAASGEAAATLREAASREPVPRLGSLLGQNKRDSVIRVSRRWVNPLIPNTFLVLAELCQPIPIMRFMVSTDLIQSIPKIFCIGWVMSADTNKPRPINTAHT
jgi:hypothetical protein